MERSNTLSFLFLLLIDFSFSCPLNQNALPISLACIQNIICATGPNGTQLVFIQNCNTSWYYGTSNTTATSFKPASTSLLSSSKNAVNIKGNFYYVLANYNNTKLVCHFFQSTKGDFQLPVLSTIIDYYPMYITNTYFRTVILYKNEVVTIQFWSNSIPISNVSCTLPYNLTKIQCLQNYICVIGTDSGMIIIFDSNQNTVKNLYNTTIKSSVILIQSKLIDSATNFSKVYIAYSSGLLSEYILQNDNFQLERTCAFFQNDTIFQVNSYITSTYLIVTDTMGNVSQIDLSTGILLDNINLDDYVANKSNVSFSVLLNNQTSYYLFNTINKAIYYVQVTPNNTDNQIILFCYNLFYYNSTRDRCAPCNQECATCNPLTGDCIDCYSGYFNSNGECLSCYYNSAGLTNYFNECFSFYDQQIMQKQKIVLQFLSNVVGYFATALNVCGLLFLFLKLINNWNIICFYFFVSVNIPFYLENILKTMFNNFNSSVLEVIGINFKPSLNLQFEPNNQKFELTDISIDFMVLNGQSIILFCYSVVLIMTVYRWINNLLAKLNVSFFQQNVSIPILEQFVVSFTVGLLPFSYIVSNTHSRNVRYKINYCMHFILFGLSLILSSFFLILDYSNRKIRNSKVHNKDDHIIAKAIDEGLIKRMKVWREDDCRQRFFFAALSFSTATLSCFPNPRIFLFFVGAVHILSLLNVVACKKRSINKVIQKIQFLCFHACFVSLYYINDDAINMNISMVAVLLIIVIAVHEMVTSIGKKIYFVYMVIKLKLEKQRKIIQFFKKDSKQCQNMKRIHPISIEKLPVKQIDKKQHLNKINKIKYKFKSFEVILHHQTQNILSTPDNPLRSKINCKRIKKGQNQVNPKKRQVCFDTQLQIHRKTTKQLDKKSKQDNI